LVNTDVPIEEFDTINNSKSKKLAIPTNITPGKMTNTSSNNRIPTKIIKVMDRTGINKISKN
jgi:hypothetical protein